jgi:eukaryotic-like serine/threonine-protein kinase
MTPQQWRRIEELFDQAVELPPGERLAFLDNACGSDSALHRQVEAMLASDDFSSTAIRGIVESMALSASGLDDSRKASEMAGRHFGPWLITGTVESDAGSAVYRAVRDDDAGRRPVALRIFDRAFESDSARARFHQKRQLLAKLDHPHIARLLDADEEASAGLPAPVAYLVSEYVDGTPITQYSAGRRLSLKERLLLFLPVCDAVAYANRQGVSHRRLKPSNILVTREGTPTVLDFGIAALQERDPAREAGGPNFIAADIGSLGEVLYEILSGAKMTAGAARGDRQLPDDLDAIVAKAMRKPPGESYQSVEDMAADMRRYLSGFPVSARQATVLYRARKYTARNRLPLAAALFTAGGLIGGTVLVLRARQRAEQRHRDLNTLAGVYLSDLDQNSGNLKTRDALIVKTLRYLDSVAPDGDGDAAFEDRLAEAYAHVGELQEQAGRPAADRRADGLESYRKSLRIRRAVVAANPGNTGSARALSQCLERLGELCLSRSELAGARNYVSEALKTLGSPGRAPGLEDLRLLAAGNESLAAIEERDGNAPAAVDAARRALAWRQRLSQADANPAARHDLARAWGQLGRLQRTRGDLEGGLRSLLAERDLREAIARKNPADTGNLSDLGTAVYNLGLLSGGDDGPNLRDPAAARRYVEQSIAMGERLLNAASNNGAAQSTMPDRYGALADLTQSSETASAIVLYRKALAAADRLPGGQGRSRVLHARWSSRLSYALRRAGKTAEARGTAEAALALMLELDLDHADPATCRDVSALYRAVGAAALQAREFEAAREAYSKSIDWTGGFFDRAHTNLELAADISASWEGLETSLRSGGDRGGALKLQGRRLALWRQWDAEMPSPFTKWQLERANYFF